MGYGGPHLCMAWVIARYMGQVTLWEVKNGVTQSDNACRLRRANTQTPTRYSVFSTHSDTQAVPAFYCILRMFKGTCSTRAFLKRTDTLSTIA